jgi:hypothetical protein
MRNALQGTTRVIGRLLVPVAAIAGCARAPAPPAVAPAPVLQESDGLIGTRASYRAVADTVVTIARPGGDVTIRDRRTLRHEASGDFDAEVTRSHRGSEAGDTDESQRAIRVGRDYFTRGSGGPFVRWEDARDEPDGAAASVLQGTRDLLAIAERCGRVVETGTTRIYALANAACAVSSGPAGAPFTAAVTRLEGETKRDSGRLAALRLVVTLDLEADGRHAPVTVEHSLTLSDTPPGEPVSAPDTVIPARRDRPVVMARSILGGLVDAWGPGAPEVLRKSPSPRPEP